MRAAPRLTVINIQQTARSCVKAPQSSTRLVDSPPDSSESWWSFLARAATQRDRKLSEQLFTLRGDRAESLISSVLSQGSELRPSAFEAPSGAQHGGDEVMMSSSDQDTRSHSAVILFGDRAE